MKNLNALRDEVYNINKANGTSEDNESILQAKEPFFFSTIKNEKSDNVNPSHYKQGKVECIEAIEAATVNLTGLEAVCTGNAIKYLWRWKEKNGVEDLKKAQWYITKLMEGLE